MKGLVLGVGLFVLTLPAFAWAGVAVIDRISGEVAAVSNDGSGFYDYDLGRYDLVDTDAEGVEAGCLKYENGRVREMTQKEKALKAAEKENDWRSDYGALYEKLRDDLVRDGLVAGSKKES